MPSGSREERAAAAFSARPATAAVIYAHGDLRAERGLAGRAALWFAAGRGNGECVALLAEAMDVRSAALSDIGWRSGDSGGGGEADSSEDDGEPLSCGAAGARTTRRSAAGRRDSASERGGERGGDRSRQVSWF